MKKQRSNLWLWVLLAVLIVIIIALIIGVIVAKNNGQNGLGGLFGGSGTSSGSSVTVGAEGLVTGSEDMSDSETDAVVREVNAIVEQQYGSDENVDDAAKVYEDAATEAMTENKLDAAAKLVVERAEYLAQNGSCHEAEEYLENTDLSKFNDQQKLTVYNGGYGISIECEDSAAQTRWYAAMNSIKDSVNQGYGR